MDNNNTGLRRSARSAVALAAGALVAACQSLGPEASTAPALEPVAAVVVPLEPIVLPTLEYRDAVVEADLLTRLRSRFSLEIAADPAVTRERDW